MRGRTQLPRRRVQAGTAARRAEAEAEAEGGCPVAQRGTTVGLEATGPQGRAMSRHFRLVVLIAALLCATQAHAARWALIYGDGTVMTVIEHPGPANEIILPPGTMAVSVPSGAPASSGAKYANGVFTAKPVPVEEQTATELRRQLTTALDANIAFLAPSVPPTNAEILAQVRALTRQVNALIRFRLERLEKVD